MNKRRYMHAYIHTRQYEQWTYEHAHIIYIHHIFLSPSHSNIRMHRKQGRWSVSDSGAVQDVQRERTQLIYARWDTRLSPFSLYSFCLFSMFLSPSLSFSLTLFLPLPSCLSFSFSLPPSTPPIYLCPPLSLFPPLPVSLFPPPSLSIAFSFSFLLPVYCFVYIALPFIQVLLFVPSSLTNLKFLCYIQ